MNNVEVDLSKVNVENDDDLKCYLAFHILQYRLNNSTYNREKYIEKYLDNRLVLDEEACLKFFNKNLNPILSEKDEIIKRKDWDLPGLSGATTHQLYHFHYKIMLSYFMENYKPKHDVALITLCSSKKPYRDNRLINQFYKMCENKADVFVLSNPGIIPIEYDNYYPFRWYNWNEDEETLEIKKQYYEALKNRIEQWFNHFTQYKKIISVIRFGETRDAFYDSDIKQEKIDVWSSEIYDKILEEYMPTFKVKGLLHSRYLNLIPVKDWVKEKLN